LAIVVKRDAKLRQYVLAALIALLSTGCANAQAKKTTAPFLVDSLPVYYQTWEEGEKKTCGTYNAVHILSCDETMEWAGSFTELLKKCALECPPETTHAERVHIVLMVEAERAKKFDAVFSKNPWPGPDRERNGWECSKVSGKVSCKPD